jgi:hypothetical protein
MPTEAQIAAKRVADEARAAAGQTTPKPKKVRKNLNDPVTQEQILNPTPMTTTDTVPPLPLTIGGQEIALHPLPAKLHREMMHSFIPVLAEQSAARGAMNLEGMDDRSKSGAVLTRWARVLAEDQALMTQFARFVARSEHSADQIIDAAALVDRARMIDEMLTSTEIYGVFVALAAVNGVFGSPK